MSVWDRVDRRDRGWEREEKYSCTHIGKNEGRKGGERKIDKEREGG